MKDKKKAAKAPKKKAAKSRPTAKRKITPEAAKSTAKLKTMDKTDKVVDSTTAWAQKRGLKQIVIWGPEKTRDAIRTAADRAGVKMSTWILEAISARLSGKKAATTTTAASKPSKKAAKPKPVKAAKAAKVKTKSTAKASKSKKSTTDVYVDDGSKGINIPPAVETSETSNDEVAA